MGTESCPLCHGYGTTDEPGKWAGRHSVKHDNPRLLGVYVCVRCEGIGNIGGPLPPRPPPKMYAKAIYDRRQRAKKRRAKEG